MWETKTSYDDTVDAEDQITLTGAYCAYRSWEAEALHSTAKVEEIFALIDVADEAVADFGLLLAANTVVVQQRPQTPKHVGVDGRGSKNVERG